jgi:hypothetical protein
METANNTYRLEQGDKEYILSASIVGNLLRMTCQNSSNENNKKFTRDFTVAQLNKIDKLFTIIKSPEQALDYIDKALSQQKVGITEENGGLKLTFYITTNGISNEIDIPLGTSASKGLESNENVKETYQAENYGNFGEANYTGNSTANQNNIESLLNNAFSQNNQDNQYFGQFQNMNTYQTDQSNNAFDINKFLQTNNDNNNYNNYIYEKPPVIGPVDDSTNQYYQNNTQYLNNYETSQNTFQTFQSYDNNTNQYVESSAYSGLVDNGQNNMTEEEIKKILQQNESVNTGDNMAQTEANANVDFSDLKDFEGTKILPVKTTSRILPVLGPFTDTDLKELDIFNMVNQNIQKNNDIPFQLVENVQATQAPPSNNVKNSVKKKTVKKGLSKKAPSQGKLKTESEEIKKLRTQVAELEQLKKKMAKMEVLEGQLTELNTLRAQVAEYNSVKSQLKEIFNLKAQNKQLKEQLSELDELRAKAEEAENLKLRVQELEKINHKYEEEIKFLKENERMYSMRSRVTNSDNKDVAYEDNQPEPEEEMTVQGDIIQDTEELELITKKINKLNQKLTVNLLYKASADSDKAEAFHAKCDQAKSTIVLVETDKGKRFGGYTTCDWSGDCIEKKDEEAFVFSLDKLKTYDNIPGEDAIGCYPKFGPIFLGCQIRIYDDAFSKGGTTFEKGLNFDTQEDFELTGGDRVFNVKEIEVYEVIKE